MKEDMTDELQDHPQELKVENSAVEPNDAPPTPKKSNKNLWIIAGIVIALLCLCSILMVNNLFKGMAKISPAEPPAIETVLDTFMKTMELKDFDKAYALFSPHTQRRIPITSVEEMAQGKYYGLFEGYQSLVAQNVNLTAPLITNPFDPIDLVAKVTGTILYKDGITGKFTASLEKVNGEWRISDVNVSAPPEKFQP
jgi:hypothetical protein